MKLKTLEIIKNSKKYIAGSLIAIAVLLVIMIVNIVSGNGAFNLDVEFSGGTSIVLDMGEDFTDVEGMKTYISDNTDETNPAVRKYEDSSYVEIKIQETDNLEVQSFVEAITTNYGLEDEDIISTNSFSPTVSSEMRNSAILAIFVACVAILIYVAIRFKDVTMGISSIIALLHDVTFVILFYAAFRIPLNYSFIAVLLTIIGYSINATIVIFDRARENRKARPSLPDGDVMNMSINQTVTRSIYTSITTLLAILFLFFMGVDSMKQFSLPILFGVAVGTYSSVFISGSVWYNLRKKINNKNNKNSNSKDNKQKTVNV